MLIIFVAAMLGIFRFRSLSYWKWVGFIFLWMFGAQFLFAGGGTLENPTGDGLISHQIRIATNDGPGMGLFAIVFIIAYWGGAILMIRKAYVAGKRFEEKQGIEAIEPVAAARKLAEAFGLTLIAGIYIYIAFVLPRQSAEETTPTVTENASPGNGSPDPIARELLATAEQMNREGPKKLNPNTTLESVSAEGRTLTYHYKLLRRDGSDESLRAFVLKNTVSSVCKDGDMLRGMKDYGIAYRYKYLLPNASTPVTVDATYSECGPLNASP